MFRICRWLIVATLALGLNSPFAMAQNSGKGGGGGGGGGGTVLPPVTYKIQWLLHGTEIRGMNNEGNVVGRFRDGESAYWFLMINDTVYDIKFLVDDSDWSNLGVWSLSDEVDGRLFVLGGGRYRGVSVAYRMDLMVSGDGSPIVLELRPLDLLPGDVAGEATDGNLVGHVVGRSRANANDLRQVFFYSDTTGTIPIDSNLRHWSGYLPRISESGFVAYDYKDLMTGERGILRWDSLTGGTVKWSVPNWCTVGGINNAGAICGQNDFFWVNGGNSHEAVICLTAVG